MAKKYNEIEAKDNMKVNNETQEDVVVEPKKEFTSVISNQPKKVKKGLMSRLVTGVIGPEGLPGIGTYVNEEIVKPAIKNIIVDAVTSGINMVMYGDKGNPVRGRSGGGIGHRPTTNYSSRYSSRPSEATHADRIVQPRISGRAGVIDYIIPDRIDAATVLTNLTESADMYGNVSVADYYDLIGVDSQYTDNNHGWTYDSISRASIIPMRGGFSIKFPPVEVI